MKYTKLIKRKSNEDGVTLIMAIVILSVVTFISFALSTLVLREIGIAKVAIRTEPAISAANAGGEIGYYRFIRGKGSVDTTGSTPYSGGSYAVTSQLYSNPYIFNIAPAGGGANQAVRYLYDPLYPNNPSADFGSVTVTNTGNKPFAITVYSLADLANPICPKTSNLNRNESTTCNLNSPVDDRYSVVFDWNGNSTIAGQMTATNSAGAAKGVPADVPGLSVTGTNGDIQRKIQIEQSH
ncbi:hypothetical protein D4R52_01915 [bacterium]|nr:MAG: hypothetical protein D4R52_01915 [bacterium]